MFGVFIATAVLVAIAELGDKTQMMSLLLATRFPPRLVFLGVLIAVLGLQLIAVAAGRLAGELLPQRLLALATAALFIAFGIWAFRDASRGAEDETAVVSSRSGLGTVFAVAGAFFIAELGDKTQVLTFAVAADPGIGIRLLGSLGVTLAEPGPAAAFVAVWAGSVLGMMVVNGVAILAGAALGRRVSRPVLGRLSGVLFVAFGLAALAQTIAQW